MPDQEVPGPDSRSQSLHLLNSLHQLSRNLAPFNKPIDTLEKTSSVSTPPGYGENSQTGSETGNPAKKIKHDPEQHIPDEILNDLYGVTNCYSSGFGIGGGAREDDQDNQEVPELDTKDSK